MLQAKEDLNFFMKNPQKLITLLAMSALGVSFLLANSMQLLFTARQRDYGMFSLDGGALYLRGFDIGEVHVPLRTGPESRVHDLAI